MKHDYQAYAKKVDGELLFFVKDFLIFEEVLNIPPITVGYGMHTQFEKACSIAGITDDNVVKIIKSKVKLQEIPSEAVVINFNDPKFKSGKKIS